MQAFLLKNVPIFIKSNGCLWPGLTLILFLTVLWGCEKKEKLTVDVSGISVNTEVHRFDQQFYTAKETSLPELKKQYPYLFPGDNNDSIWLEKMKDADEQALFAKTQTVFKDFTDIEQQFTDLFKHVKYYYPKFKPPKVITLLTNVDYENRVVYADSLLFVSLDVYLGKNSEIYNDFPHYIKKNFTKDHLIVDVASGIADVQIPMAVHRNFVAKMIQQGKKMYLLDAYLPNVGDVEKMGYTQEEIEWAEHNDVEVWKYFVQNDMLFSSDMELGRRFIDNAPFSKFYQANDNETPGRIGVWFGWQIVRAYMRNNDVGLQKMLGTPNEEIFKQSKYKPAK